MAAGVDELARLQHEALLALEELGGDLADLRTAALVGDAVLDDVLEGDLALDFAVDDGGDDGLVRDVDRAVGDGGTGLDLGMGRGRDRHRCQSNGQETTAQGDAQSFE